MRILKRIDKFLNYLNSHLPETEIEIGKEYQFVQSSPFRKDFPTVTVLDIKDEYVLYSVGGEYESDCSIEMFKNLITH